MTFGELVEGLKNGDFTRLDPQFGGSPSPVESWLNEGAFADHPEARAEALTCACFNGRTEVAKRFLDTGADPAGGIGTGMNALHWSANRGQMEAVHLLIGYGSPLEAVNHYGGTVLGCAVWSLFNETKPNHLEIIKVLVEAGADVTQVKFPTGNAELDRVLSVKPL